MASLWKLCLLVSLLLERYLALGAYQSAGCSDEGCGIPCYLRPAEDDCHYTDHGDSPCDAGGGDELVEQLWVLNNTLVRLEDKLIQKGIRGNCHPLPEIEKGGVIYTDLLITPGVIGTYVCEEGYSLHGHAKYECAVDGVWLGNTTGQLPTCEESLVICEPLVAIPNGHVSYQVEDTTVITPGDVVTYYCDDPYHLVGNGYRVCLKNGTWTGEEPKCTAPNTQPSARTGVTDNQVQVAVGTTVGVLIAVVLAVLIAVLVVFVVRKWKHKGSSRTGYNPLKDDNHDGPISSHTKDTHDNKLSQASPGERTMETVETLRTNR